MYNILTLNNISKAGLNYLGNNYKISESTTDPDAILVRSASMIDFNFPQSLIAIARAGVGVNNIPTKKCSEHGIVVFNTPSANANAVKELVVAGLIMSSRRVSASIKWINNLDLENINFEKTVEQYKSMFSGPEIKGKTLGVIGLGAIGTLVANAAVNLDMNVLGYDPYISIDAAWNLSRHVIHVDDFDRLLSQSDYISLHVPLTDVTKNMINEKTISQMKRGVHLLNYSRADIVDTSAIINAVSSGYVKTYATDFPKKEFLNQSNITVTPHLGASTPESENNCAVMAARQVKDFIENGNIINSVNLPNISMERDGDQRICIFHRNVANVNRNITGILADHHINIVNMQSRAKNEFAYAIMDIEGNLSPEILGNISSLDNVIRVRVI